MSDKFLNVSATFETNGVATWNKWKIHGLVLPLIKLKATNITIEATF